MTKTHTHEASPRDGVPSFEHATLTKSEEIGYLILRADEGYRLRIAVPGGQLLRPALYLPIGFAFDRAAIDVLTVAEAEAAMAEEEA